MIRGDGRHSPVTAVSFRDSGGTQSCLMLFSVADHRCFKRMSRDDEPTYATASGMYRQSVADVSQTLWVLGETVILTCWLSPGFKRILLQPPNRRGGSPA